MTTLRTWFLRTALLAAGVVLLLGVTPAQAKTAKTKAPCWKTLINDWYDGRIDGTYPIPCYRAALKHLPSDVEAYSSARDDIKQALQKRITQGVNTKPDSTPPSTNPGTTTNNNTDTTGNDPQTGIPGNPPGNDGPGNPSTPGGGEPGPGRDATGVIPGAGSPDSVPIPLIVLGSIAALLMAAGAAGFIARRARARRLQLASAAAIGQHPAEPPPPPE